MSDNAWSLPGALGIQRPKELVAFVGGGGKTSLMFALAAALPGRVVITTTTRIFAAQMKLAAAVCGAADLSQLGNHLAEHGSCLVIGAVEGEKASGVDPSLPGQLLARPDVDYVLVEADGSRMRPIKAPAGHEPVVPPETTLLVPVAGLDALDGPLEEVAHRPELVRAILSGSPRANDLLTADDRLTAAGMAELLTNPTSGGKNAPPSARLIPFINKAETPAQERLAQAVAQDILHRAPHVSRALVGAARTQQPVRAVWRRVGAAVLAAGESRRMGHNKLLLPWQDRTVLEQTVENASGSHLNDYIVATGHQADAIRDLPMLAEARLVHNPDYQQGMLSSVQAAIRQAPADWSAVLVLLGDQPMVGSDIINRILDAYAQRPVGLVVPRFEGRRGNPVLIDRCYFDELLGLPVGSAPRVLLARHPEDIAWVEAGTEAVLADLDRPEDYARWRPVGAAE